MINRKMNISEIETYLYSLFNNVVSEHTYVGKLPDTIKSTWDDMLLIDAGEGVSDYEGYGSGSVLLFAYARPIAGGNKNVAKLKAMEEAIDSAIEGQDSSGDYYVYRMRTYSDYDYSRDWHCNIIAIGLTIK